MCYVSIERSFHSASVPCCCIKFHAEMAELSLKIQDFKFICACMSVTVFLFLAFCL